MSTPTTKPATPSPAATKRLFATLTAFLGPMAKDAGLTIRPFSLTTFTSMQLAGIAVGSEEFAKMSEEQQSRQLIGVLAIQSAPLDQLKTAIRAAAGDFEKFYWDFVWEFGSALPVETMLALETQLAEELPAIEAAQLEIVAPDNGSGRKERPPGE